MSNTMSKLNDISRWAKNESLQTVNKTDTFDVYNLVIIYLCDVFIYCLNFFNIIS